jgi:HAMP domain-containing protein/putative methionine-R-sulfoxide reductase with GAF domain
MVQEDDVRLGNRYGRVRRRLILIIATANTCGAALIAFYFSNLHSGDWPGFFTGTDVGPLVLILATVGLLALGNVSSGRLLGPLWTWYRQVVAEEADSVQISPKIQSLALNLPAISAGTVMMMWFLAGLAFGILSGFDLINYQWYWDRFFQVLIGSEVAGSVTMVLTYFAIERAWRSELPLFFAGAEMTKTPAFRMRVRTRLLILFIITVAPLVDLAALSYSQAVQIVSAPQPATLLPRLLRLEVFLVGVGLLTAIVLARTLGASLIEPLEALSKRMRKVEEGDLDVQVAVTSNDEIGVMSQCFNSMVESLQRRDVELRTIYQISQDITASLELDQTLRTVLEQVRQMIAYDGAEICLREEDGVLRARAWAGFGQIRIEADGRVYQSGEGYTGWIGECRQSLLVPDVDAYHEQQPVTRQIADGSTQSEEVVMNSYLGAPLLVGQKVVGTLELAGVRKGAFDEHSRQLLETIAPQAAIAIDNAVRVLERERRLKEQIAQLHIQIDHSKRDRQVAEIAETDYFQQLQEKAQQMRKDRAEKPDNRLTKPRDSV